jgi:hypothetical protein
MCNNNNNNNNNNNDLLSVFPYNGSSPDKTTTTISKEIVRQRCFKILKVCLEKAL